MKNVYDRVGSTLDDTKGARPSRNTSPIGREHEPLNRAAGLSPGVPIGFLNIILRETSDFWVGCLFVEKRKGMVYYVEKGSEER